jgi:hypothetical protein
MVSGNSNMKSNMVRKAVGVASSHELFAIHLRSRTCESRLLQAGVSFEHFRNLNAFPTGRIHF